MSRDAETLWRAVVAISHVVAFAGLLVIIVGLCRRRSVMSGTGGHLVGAAAGVLGAVLVERLIRGVDDDVVLQSAAMAALAATVVSAGAAERLRTTAHLAIGASCGALLIPGLLHALERGVLASIDAAGRGFVDPGGTGALLTASGWGALVVSAMTGPRLGRFGGRGQARVVPGSSVPLAVAAAGLVGPAIAVAASGGLLVASIPPDAESLVGVVEAGLVAGAAGAVTGALVGALGSGRVGSTSAVRGLLGGVVASVPMAGLDGVWWTPFAVGVAGGAGALVGFWVLGRIRIDDPVGVAGSFGVAGAIGLLAPGALAPDVGLVDGAGIDQLFAQLAGLLIVIAVAVVGAGVLSGALRFLGWLRIPYREEIVSVDDLRIRRASS